MSITKEDFFPSTITAKMPPAEKVFWKYLFPSMLPERPMPDDLIIFARIIIDDGQLSSLLVLGYDEDGDKFSGIHTSLDGRWGPSFLSAWPALRHRLESLVRSAYRDPDWTPMTLAQYREKSGRRLAGETTLR